MILVACGGASTAQKGPEVGLAARAPSKQWTSAALKAVRYEAALAPHESERAELVAKLEAVRAGANEKPTRRKMRRAPAEEAS